ncbi:MAG: hypothetical protein ACTHJT_06765 [Cytophaga sp.]|uniref:hypothetical protein n=1 Tax=Cytophaga sp. TaxID=29535 RepID=UPI003F820DEF
MKNFFVLLVLCISCNAPAQTDHTAAHKAADTLAAKPIAYAPILKQNIPDSSDSNFLILYQKLKTKITSKRTQLYQCYLSAASQTARKQALDSARIFLHAALVNNVFPFWYGTAWDFNGTSNEPQRGQIACGYFVSTTLKHAGCNLNRYKVAQQYSHSIVKTLCSDVKRITSVDELIAYVSGMPDQLYVVGLDNHVGFISKKDNEVTFIHSTFVGDVCVISERAETSPVLKNSNVYVTGSLTANDTLVLNWLTNASIAVIY